MKAKRFRSPAAPEPWEVRVRALGHGVADPRVVLESAARSMDVAARINTIVAIHEAFAHINLHEGRR